VTSLTDSKGAVLTNRTVTYTSSDASVVAISNTGRVTGIAPGSASVTAESEGKRGSANITVSAVSAEIIAVEPESVSVVIGAKAQLVASARAKDGTPLPGRTPSWVSGSPTIVTVTSSGEVTGVAIGQAAILATIDGVTAVARVFVRQIPVGTVAVSPTSTSLQIGATTQFSVVVRDSLGTVVTDRPVSWSSSNAGVASISSSGLVTAIAAGSANVLATAGGKSGSATITVSPPTAASVSVAPTAATVEALKTVQH
jgi:uncharacterized protein YjdB